MAGYKSRETIEQADMAHNRKRQECGARTTLVVSLAHLTSHLHIDAPASSARRQMCLGRLLALCSRRAVSMGEDRRMPVLAHSARRRDDRDLFELLVRAASSRHDGLEWDSKAAGGELDADPACGHERHDLLLEVVELRHEVRCPCDSLPCLDNLGRLASVQQLVRNELEVHPLSGADAHRMASATVLR
jgi:hypothetical protein